VVQARFWIESESKKICAVKRKLLDLFNPLSMATKTLLLFALIVLIQFLLTSLVLIKLKSNTCIKNDQISIFSPLFQEEVKLNILFIPILIQEN
jgi:hypothetical protein